MNQLKTDEGIKLVRSPRSVEIAITNTCNLRCAYCSHFTSAADVPGDVSLEDWLCFFEELNRCSVLKVCLDGGEPFHRKDIIQIIQGIVANRMRFSVLSNGTLLTDEIAAFLASTRRCDFIQISLDGSIATTHDALRGEGSFRKALAGIQALQKHNIPVAVRVTIHKHNLNQLEELTHFLLEEIGLRSFSTNAASYMGLCRKNSSQVQLTVGERSLAMEKLLTLSNKYPNRISAMAGPLAEAKGWLEMEEARHTRKAQPAGRGYLTGCAGPMSKIALRPDGVFVPCILLSHIELGKMNKDDFRAIWQSHPALKSLRSRHLIPLNEFAFCKDCLYVDYCAGGCPALSYTVVGNMNHPNPDTCLRKFLAEGGYLPRKGFLEATTVVC
ncbi:MAG: SynChlorMet cassette radical SAM/SPASM protein ScmE [Candidatus Omnitrophota bacterium]